MFHDSYLNDLLKEKMKTISVLLEGVRIFLGLLILSMLVLSFAFSGFFVVFIVSVTIAAVLSVGSAYLLLRARASDQRAADVGRAEAGSISKVDGRVHLQRGQTLAATMANIASAVVSIDPKRTLVQASLSARKNAIACVVCMLFILITLIYSAVSEYKISTIVERRLIEFLSTTVLFAAVVFGLRARAMFKRSQLRRTYSIHMSAQESSEFI